MTPERLQQDSPQDKQNISVVTGAVQTIFNKPLTAGPIAHSASKRQHQTSEGPRIKAEVSKIVKPNERGNVPISKLLNVASGNLLREEEPSEEPYDKTTLGDY